MFLPLPESVGITLFLFSTYSTGNFWTTLVVTIISALILFLAEWGLTEQIRKEPEGWAYACICGRHYQNLVDASSIYPFSLFNKSLKKTRRAVSQNQN